MSIPTNPLRTEERAHAALARINHPFDPDVWVSPIDQADALLSARPAWDAPPTLSSRDSVLHGALKAVSQRDNEAAYGTGNSFDAAGNIKAAIMGACPTPVPGPVEIAVTQIAVKLARLAGSGFKHQDSAVDLCGYAAWLYELATRATDTDPKEPTP